MSRTCFLNINLPLKLRHLSIQDTSPGPQGVHNGGVPLYFLAEAELAAFLVAMLHFLSSII